jgi:hypothetical protein
MGLVSRNLTVKYDGHEIALFVGLTGSGACRPARYRLYIDGKLADEHPLTVWLLFYGSPVTLRGQLPPGDSHSKPRRVKVVANVRWFRTNDYLFFVDDEQIHQEWATFGGV